MGPKHYERFLAFDHFCVPLGDNRYRFYSKFSDLSATLTQQEFNVFRNCSDFKTLSEHEAAQKGVPGISSTLQRLAELGVLTPLSAFTSRLKAAPKGSKPSLCRITAIASPTKDRPVEWERCFESYMQALSARTGELRFVVVDQSTKPENAERVRAACDRLTRTYGRQTQYVGFTERQEIVDQLASQSIPRDILAFAFLNPLNSGNTIGAARNLIQILTSGEAVLSVDDDTTANFAELPHRKDELSVGGSGDPFTHRFFDSRDQLSEQVSTQPLDILARHEDFLGKTVLELAQSALAKGRLAFGAMDWRDWGDLIGGNAVIALSATGLLGDSAAGSPIGSLFLPDPYRQMYWGEEDATRRRLVARQIFRGIPTHKVLRAQSLMTYHAAFDHRSVLWPFIPLGRNEDGIWGQSLMKLWPEAKVVYLPFGVRHDPLPARTFAPIESYLVPSQPHLETLVELIIKNANTDPTGVVERRDLARDLHFVANLSDASLRELVTLLHVNLLGGHIEAMTQILSQAKISPFERKIRQAYLAEIRKSIETFRFEGPGDIISQPQMGDPTVALRAVLRGFGDLFLAWGDITLAARRLGLNEPNSNMAA